MEMELVHHSQLPEPPSNVDLGICQRCLALSFRPQSLVGSDLPSISPQQEGKQHREAQAVQNDAQSTHCSHPSVPRVLHGALD